MGLFSIYLITYSVLFLISGAEDMPSFIHVCHENDPNMNTCIMAAVEDLRPFLVSGVPQYKIPSIEPLVIHDLISEDITGMKITTSNVSAYGCSDYFVRRIDLKSEDQKITIDIDIPKLRIEAHYDVDGKILLLPIKGNGNLEANVTDCISQTVLAYEFYTKNDEKYLKFTSINLKAKVSGGKVRLENLFNGDKVMLGIINDVVNKNLDSFLNELMPLIEKGLASAFIDIGNAIVNNFTYQQLFPN